MTKPKYQRNQTVTALEYQVNITYDPRDNLYVARVPELENCHTHGTTPEEALSHTKDAVALWLKTAKARKIPIPEPLNRKRFSGKFVLRTPKDLHASLVRTALQLGKSMNELAVEFLERGLGTHAPHPTPAPGK